MEKTALVIIDMQKDVLKHLVKTGYTIIPQIQKALEHARTRKMPIIFLTREHRSTGLDVDQFRVKMFGSNPILVEGSPGAEMVDELKPLPHEIQVNKKRFSGFFHTDLLLILIRLGIQELVLCGVQTPNSIRATAMDAISYDYKVKILQDASTTQTPAIHEANLLDLKNMGVEIIQTEGFLQ